MPPSYWKLACLRGRQKRNQFTLSLSSMLLSYLTVSLSAHKDTAMPKRHCVTSSNTTSISVPLELLYQHKFYYQYSNTALSSQPRTNQSYYEHTFTSVTASQWEKTCFSFTGLVWKQTFLAQTVLHQRYYMTGLNLPWRSYVQWGNKIQLTNYQLPL